MEFRYHIHIMTLFPDVVGDMLCESILGRAQERNIIRIDCHQIRDYTLNKQKQVDNYPYGGGHGAVMQADVPHSLSDPFMSLPYHLYILVNNGFSLDYAYGTAFVLMLFLLIIQLICKFITYLRKDN